MGQRTSGLYGIKQNKLFFFSASLREYFLYGLCVSARIFSLRSLRLCENIFSAVSASLREYFLCGLCIFATLREINYENG